MQGAVAFTARDGIINRVSDNLEENEKKFDHADQAERAKRRASRFGNPAKAAKARDKQLVTLKEEYMVERKHPTHRDWVPYVFVPMGLLGVLWLVVFYIAGSKIGFMSAMGNWNFGVGLGLIAAAFGVSTMWK